MTSKEYILIEKELPIEKVRELEPFAERTVYVDDKPIIYRVAKLSLGPDQNRFVNVLGRVVMPGYQKPTGTKTVWVERVEIPWLKEQIKKEICKVEKLEESLVRF